MASSNLFKSLYSTDHTYQSSGYTCLSAINESETSFDISGDSGVITDSNGDTLASIDLSSIHVGDISLYNIETRILLPYSCYVLQGQEYGLACTTYYFELPNDIVAKDNYSNYVNCSFEIIYNQHNHIHDMIDITISEDSDFVESINTYFENNNIDVVVSILNLQCLYDSTVYKDYMVFTALTEGYFFYIKNLQINPVLMSLDYPDSPFSNELEDTKLAVYNAIEEVKPVYYKLNEDGSKTEDTIIKDTTDEYTVDCELYKWFVTYFDDIIDNYKILKKVLKLFDDYYESSEETTEETTNTISLLAENEPDDTVIIDGDADESFNDLDNTETTDELPDNNENDSIIEEPVIDEALLLIYEKANKLLKDTVFDSDSSVYNASILDHYEFSDIQKIIDLLLIAIKKASMNYAEHYWLPEIAEWRIPMMKYPNGAFKGIVIIPDYPDDENYDLSTLYINHIQTLVNINIPVSVKDPEGNDTILFKPETFGVMSNATFNAEREEYQHNHHERLSMSGNKQLQTDIISGWDEAEYEDPEDNMMVNPDYNHFCCNDSHNEQFDYDLNKFKPNDIIYLGDSCYSDKAKILGIFKYMDYVTENHQWLKIGQGYMALGADDDSQSVIKNLLNSVMIYNPNSIPIRIKYLIFS